MLLTHLIPRALILARPSAGKSSAARMAIMAITTSNSIKVKPLHRGFWLREHALDVTILTCLRLSGEDIGSKMISHSISCWCLPSATTYQGESQILTINRDLPRINWHTFATSCRLRSAPQAVLKRPHFRRFAAANGASVPPTSVSQCSSPDPGCPRIEQAQPRRFNPAAGARCRIAPRRGRRWGNRDCS